MKNKQRILGRVPESIGVFIAIDKRKCCAAYCGDIGTGGRVVRNECRAFPIVVSTNT